MLKNPSPNKGADVENDPYLPMFKKLFEAVNEQNIRLENMRILLVKRGVFSDADFNNELVQTRKDWSTAFAEMVSRALEEAREHLQQQVLESHKGKAH